MRGRAQRRMRQATPATWDGVRRLHNELPSTDPRSALFNAACDALRAQPADAAERLPVKHNGRTWWATRTAGPQGVSLLALYSKPKAESPTHLTMVAEAVVH